MAFIPVPDISGSYNRMVENAKRFVLRNTGRELNVTDSDGLSVILEVNAEEIHDRLTLADRVAAENSPGPNSPQLDLMAGLFGLTRIFGESNVELWTRIQLASQQASLGSQPALTKLVLAQPGVFDVSFDPTPDGNFNAYLVAVAASEADFTTPPGTPSATLNSTIGGLLNAGDKVHLGRSFNMLVPTATRYTLVSTVTYDETERPDTAVVRKEIEDIFVDWVVSQRKLATDLSLSTLCLTANEVRGLIHHQTEIRVTGSGVQFVPSSGRKDRWFSSNGIVKVIKASNEIESGRINILYSTVT